jgi:hypothetical protein
MLLAILLLFWIEGPEQQQQQQQQTQMISTMSMTDLL